MLFSIAIPVYKNAFLKECIASILCQTFEEFELIIVNDCSPDPVDQTIKKFDDKRIKYFKNEKNIGGVNLVDNWNNCLEKACGDYFVMMGDDDTMHCDYLLEFTRLIKKYPDLDVYHCRSVIIDENSVPVGLTPSWPEFESVYENMWHRLFAKRLQYISDFVFRTDTLKKKGGFYFLPLAWSSDDISAYIATGAKGIAHTNKAVFNYRRNGFSISSIGNHEKKIEALKMSLQWFNSFLAEPPEGITDSILHKQIKNTVAAKVQKQKEQVLKESFVKNNFKNFIFFLINRKRLSISVGQIVKAFYRSYNIIK
jgi:glycosyltransferase involved in cell wall biosynthesis